MLLLLLCMDYDLGARGGLDLLGPRRLGETEGKLKEMNGKTEAGGMGAGKVGGWETERRLGSWKDDPNRGYLSRVLGLLDRRPWSSPGRKHCKVRATESFVARLWTQLMKDQE